MFYYITTHRSHGGRAFTCDSGAPVRPAKCLEWRGVQRNSLLGFAKIRFGTGIIISDIAVNQSGSRMWASPPSKPWVEGGRLIIDTATGKPKYSPVITFESHGIQRSWSQQVLRAIRAEFPQALPASEDDSDSLEGQEALAWHRRQAGAA
jgi:hypothetical protein